MMSDVRNSNWIISLMPIELFHTYSKDLGRDVLGNVKKQTNKQQKTKITQCVIA